MLLTGGCACEDIRYECTEEPIVQLICHWRDCQRATGSAFATVMFFAADKIAIFEGHANFSRTRRRQRSPISEGLLWQVRQPDIRPLGRGSTHPDRCAHQP